MKKRTYLALPMLLLACAVVVAPAPVLATSHGGGGPGSADDGDGITLQNPLQADSFQELINQIITALVFLATPVYVVILLVGAYKLMTGSANKEKVKQAKNIFLYSTIGYIILILSRGIVAIVSSIV